MQILLTDAKTMLEEATCHIPTQSPYFLSATTPIVEYLHSLDLHTLATTLHCNEKIAQTTAERYTRIVEQNAPILPALAAYNGLVYKHMHIESWTTSQWEHANHHLLIPSYLYGLLRPSDGISPYRIDQRCHLPSPHNISLIEYWRSSELTHYLLNCINTDDGILIDLTTAEFRHLFKWKEIEEKVCVIRPQFCVYKKDKLMSINTHTKMCRGAMAHHLLTHCNLSAVKSFSFMGYTYSASESSPERPIFTNTSYH